AIRNAFAHNVHGCTFGDSSVESRIVELKKSSGFIDRNAEIREDLPAGLRGDFLMTVSWMLYAINMKVERAVALNECEPEWGYDTRVGEGLTPIPAEPPGR